MYGACFYIPSPYSVRHTAMLGIPAVSVQQHHQTTYVLVGKRHDPIADNSNFYDAITVANTDRVTFQVSHGIWKLCHGRIATGVSLVATHHDPIHSFQ